MGIFDFLKKKKGVDASSAEANVNADWKTDKFDEHSNEQALSGSTELPQENIDEYHEEERAEEIAPIAEATPGQPDAVFVEENVSVVEPPEELAEDDGIDTVESSKSDEDIFGEQIQDKHNDLPFSEKPPTSSENPGDAYMGNLEHTAIIDQLLRVPREERNDDWVGNFLSHVATASFACGEPQVIQGPDNFPYFQIFIPEANKPFQCYVLEHMLNDFLLENGLGVALEPRGGEVEWVLSYGDLLHYSVHRTFAIPPDHPFGKAKEGDETIQSDEEMLVGSPSEHVLPKLARHVIKSFLQAQGVQDPKVCLIDRSKNDKGQDLVFNLVPWQFESQQHYRAIMQALGWFLPRYYSYIGAEERAFEGHFERL
ncbi:hypothetical protein [Sphingobacterium deserti]|nr:hypothetical protein [Sphingobacterium deserti]